MKIKDKISSWFIRNIVLPKVEDISQPGFIIIPTSIRKEKINMRELFLSESLIELIENSISNIKRGDFYLYLIGKKFGYTYSYFSDFPTINNKKIETFAYFVVRWVEATYASSISHTIDIKSKIFSLKMKDYIVCRHNGKGYLVGHGGIAGIWSYVMQDLNIEAVQPKCQGRGDKECLVIAAPYETLVKMGYKPIRCEEIEKIEMSPEYKKFNEIRPTRWATKSLKNLIDSGIFEYKHGQVTYRGERFFLCEASFMYILEKELKKVKNGLKILWDCSFEFGKNLTKISGRQEPSKFITDFFSALGFGDILVLEKKGRYEIIVKYFPWFNYANEIDFTMFRGMLSGVISGFTEKEIILKKIEKDTREGNLSLYIKE